MASYHIPLCPEKTYHVFSRATGKEKLFVEDRNYSFFLEKAQKHIFPIADILCWCLLPNHFHFLIRIKDVGTLNKRYNEIKKKETDSNTNLPDFVMEQFSNLLNSYTKSFNKVYKRKGSLFIDYLRRVEITEDSQFTSTVFYIHKNPVHHCISKSLDLWKWSSYHNILSQKSDAINEVLKEFNGLETFLEYHKQTVLPKNIDDVDD